ncbi:MAG: hypothetical protein QXU18_12475, partial [Thermoplasmatales archaeon]
MDSYGGKITGETDKLLFFSTDKPFQLVSRVAFSKRIGIIIEEQESIEVKEDKRYALREKKIAGRDSLI